MTFRSNLRAESIFRRSLCDPCDHIDLLTDLPGNRSLFPSNVPVGCNGCCSLSYLEYLSGSRSIVEYISILYYRRLSELYRCSRISIHYSDPPLGVRSNTPLQACACVRTCKVSWLSVRFCRRLSSCARATRVLAGWNSSRLNGMPCDFVAPRISLTFSQKSCVYATHSRAPVTPVGSTLA